MRQRRATPGVWRWLRPVHGVLLPGSERRLRLPGSERWLRWSDLRPNVRSRPGVLLREERGGIGWRFETRRANLGNIPLPETWFIRLEPSPTAAADLPYRTGPAAAVVWPGWRGYAA